MNILSSRQQQVRPLKAPQRGVGGSVLGIARALTDSFKAFPDFVYPSILDATSQQKAQILKTLDSLPLKHVAAAETIGMTPFLTMAKGPAAGYALSMELGFSNQILLSDKAVGQRMSALDRVVVHEVGHVADFETNPFQQFHWVQIFTKMLTAL